MPEYLPDICPFCEQPGYVRAERVTSGFVPHDEVDGFACDNCGHEYETIKEEDPSHA